MRSKRFSLEDQVGGLAGDERYELRRVGTSSSDVTAWEPHGPTTRPLHIRAARVTESEESTAA
jgi:hypothetical protein